MKLIIVESPTKANTIKKFLGSKYEVISCYGHVRDLPKGDLGVDTENNFKPRYVIPTKARKRVSILKKAVKNASLVILATDEDREGEAIAWHLKEALDLNNNDKQVQRIVFHEITKNAILKALDKARDIDLHLVNAQQARRILDRLVGYKLSPLLWKKVVKGLSAGRVQSVALRLICDREGEIKAFKPIEYWSIIAELSKNSSQKNIFHANLLKINNKAIPRLGIKCKVDANKILTNLSNAKYKIINIEKKQNKKYALPPFTTSTLQQDASRRLGFSAKQTMMFAQKLYEKGYITYHRTDSLNLSKNFLTQVEKYVQNNLAKKYLNITKYKTKSKGAQEAHEAIRPTKLDKKIENNKLYNLIWQRALASQMSPAIMDSTRVDILANKYMFRANGQTMKFDGFLRIYPIKVSENLLPELKINKILDLKKLIPEQHFTKPPSRYSDASLVKSLEKHGIGRPSTYASIISTIQTRGYVEKIAKKFHAKEIGIIVNKLLVKHFPKIVDIEFTAQMEEKFDKIAKGRSKWQPIISNFYKPFNKNLEEKYKILNKADIMPDEQTNKKCEKCGKPMVIKMGRFGKFLACSGFPECKNAKPIKKGTGVKCPKCKKGELVERRTKKGKRVFYGCETYPKCDFATWDLKKLEV
ncbi:DNA topoisomerase I [bacterium]|nr:DNA topoisomerase I [bacterium]|tara:strand:- start:621 stop:2549 length:1929 start_codon:yes stop_codon:yes gene_type:complete